MPDYRSKWDAINAEYENTYKASAWDNFKNWFYRFFT